MQIIRIHFACIVSWTPVAYAFIKNQTTYLSEKEKEREKKNRLCSNILHHSFD